MVPGWERPGVLFGSIRQLRHLGGERGRRGAAQATSHEANDFAPAWSANGEIVFASDRQPTAIWSTDSTGAERQVLQTPRIANVPSPNFDGSQVAYHRLGDGHGEIVLGTEVVSGGENVFPFRPQWLEDGTLFYTADGKIKRRAAGAPTAETVEFTARVPLPARAAYTRALRDPDDAGPHPVLGVVGPSLSPDGEGAAFAAIGDIWTMRIGEAPVRVTNDAAADLDPAWSPDGRSLAFSSDRAGSMDVWTRDLKTGRDRRVAHVDGKAAMAPVWSPDGRSIAFHASSGLFGADLSIADLASGRVRVLHAGLFGPSRATWSPDGNVLMVSAHVRASTRFREGTNQLMAIDVDRGTVRTYAPEAHRSLGPRHGGGPVWSPDGQSVVFVMDGTLWKVDVDATGAPRGAPTKLTNEMSDWPSWSGNSRRILYQANETLKILDVADGTTSDVPFSLTYETPPPATHLLVHAGGLFDGVADTLRHDVDLVIEGRRIVSVDAHDNSRHQGVTVVDASDAVVMPGLIEMHGHPFPEYGEPAMRAWLAYGITTVRNPGGTAYGSVELREAVDARTRVGPRLFTAGYQLDGSRIYYPLSAAISSSQHLQWEIERAHRLQHDIIKAYVRLPDTLYRELVERAHAAGIPVTSHEIYPAVAFGADGTEHTSGTSRRGFSPKMGPFGYAYQDVIDLLSKGGMAMSPTLSLGRFPRLAADDPSLIDDVRLSGLLPPWVSSSARAAVERLRAGASGANRGGGGNEEGGRRTVRELAAAGASVIAGTDSPISPYGISLHTEIEEYVAAGLTPAQALKAATAVPAGVLGLESHLGTVAPGRLADLIVIEGDPLTDVKNTRRVRHVIKDGTLYERTRLERPGGDMTSTRR